MLDHRGTGRSTPAGALAGMTPRQQAEHLTLFPRRLDRARRGPGRRGDLRRGRRARLEGRDLLAELKLDADAALLAGRARPAQL
jgi:hypothetical protein